MDGVRLRRGREGAGEATSAWIVPSLRWKSAGHGCGNPVEVLLLAALFQDQEEVFLHPLCQTIGLVLLIVFVRRQSISKTIEKGKKNKKKNDLPC